MHETLILLSLGLTATAVGARLAGCGTPACHWSSLGAITLKTRLGMLTKAAPGRRRVRLAALALAGLLSAGALAAYAAQPSAPERLPSEVAGVTGSGDALTLLLNAGPNPRNLKVGDVYEDGWVVRSISPSEASLAKGGEVRRIGLNPTGALGGTAPKGDPSRVEIAGDTIEARLATETAIMNEYHLAQAASGGSSNGFDRQEMVRLLGPVRTQAFFDNDSRLGQLMKAKARTDALARGDVNAVRAYDRLPVAGPDSFVVPVGLSQDQAARAAGLSGSIGYSIDFAASEAPDPSKPQVMVKCFTPTTPASALGCETL